MPESTGFEGDGISSAKVPQTTAPRQWVRRDALKGLASLALSSALPAWGLGIEPNQTRVRIRRPHIFITGEEVSGLKSIARVKEAIKDGISREIWARILEACDREIGAPALTARSLLEGRSPSSAAQNNPDYTVCHAAGQRVLRNALAMLLTEKDAYRKTALDQMEALLDESVWPDWIDQAHLRFGLPADLRTGMLSQDLAVGFDWLYPFLDDGERDAIVEGIDRRGIQPFEASMEQDPWWSHDLSNWYTVIIGGLGIAGMALGDAHPRSERLIRLSLPMMRRYLSIYGREGEFNESVAYSNATRIPVIYFHAYACLNTAAPNALARRPFPQTGEWTIYSTLPPGRYAVFGDGWIGASPQVEYMAAIATASQDPVLQGFCQQHIQASSNPFLLLWHDPSLGTASPGSQLTLGRAYEDNGAQVYSRSDWDPEKPEMVVYGKAKRDHHHAHNDLGQLCIDSFGKRMVVDLGSPSAYPADYFDENRWQYYNASTKGHNVPLFDGREQLSSDAESGVDGNVGFESVNGRYTQTYFDDRLGGYWQMDLTAAYEGVISVKRTVVHLLPQVAVALDEGELSRDEEISLRWHTIVPARPSRAGTFRIANGEAAMNCQVSVLKGNLLRHSLERHEYAAPFDHDRTGALLEQRREPYVETVLTGRRYRVLSLFCGEKENHAGGGWKRTGAAWTAKCDHGDIRVEAREDLLIVSNQSILRSLRVRL